MSGAGGAQPENDALKRLDAWLIGDDREFIVPRYVLEGARAALAGLLTERHQLTQERDEARITAEGLRDHAYVLDVCSGRSVFDDPVAIEPDEPRNRNPLPWETP